MPFLGWGATGVKYADEVIGVADDAAAYIDDVVGAGDEAAGVGDEAADAADEVRAPCVLGAAPTGKGRGLAAPLASNCFLSDPSLLSNADARSRAQKMANNIRDHLTPSDLEGAWRDLRDDPVPDPRTPGAFYDHIGEVNLALDSIRTSTPQFKELLRDPRVSVADKAIIQEYLSAASQTLDYVEKVLTRDQWIPGTKLPITIKR